jgi:hypothetical protein
VRLAVPLYTRRGPNEGTASRTPTVDPQLRSKADPLRSLVIRGYIRVTSCPGWNSVPSGTKVDLSEGCRDVGPHEDLGWRPKPTATVASEGARLRTEKQKARPLNRPPNRARMQVLQP